MSFQLREDVALAETEYGLVLLNQVRGDYFTLNATAVFVLELLLAKQTTSDITEALCARFDLASDIAERDVSDLIAELLASGLITGDQRRHRIRRFRTRSEAHP